MSIACTAVIESTFNVKLGRTLHTRSYFSTLPSTNSLHIFLSSQNISSHSWIQKLADLQDVKTVLPGTPHISRHKVPATWFLSDWSTARNVCRVIKFLQCGRTSLLSILPFEVSFNVASKKKKTKNTRPYFLTVLVIFVEDFQIFFNFYSNSTQVFLAFTFLQNFSQIF